MIDLDQSTFKSRQSLDRAKNKTLKNIQETFGTAQTFEFLKNREKVVDKIDFNGKPTKKVQFIVINAQDPRRKEKKLELSRKHILRIYNELRKGYSVLEILRIGMGKETQYIVKGVKFHKG